MQFIFVFVFLTPALAIKRKLKMVIFPVCCTLMHLLCIMAEWQGCCGHQLQTTRAPLNWQLAVANWWPRTTTGCHVSRRWALQTYIYIYIIYTATTTTIATQTNSVHWVSTWFDLTVWRQCICTTCYSCHTLTCHIDAPALQLWHLH